MTIPWFLGESSAGDGTVSEERWGRGSLRAGRRFRVVIFNSGDSRFASFFFSANGLENATDDTWPDFLVLHDLVRYAGDDRNAAARCFWDERRGLMWEVNVCLGSGETLLAECRVQTELHLPFMAWRGPRMGEILHHGVGIVTDEEFVGVRENADEWWSYGDELVLAVADHLLRIRYYNCASAAVVMSVDDMPGSRGFDIELRYDEPDFFDAPTAALRAAIARLYEWTEHCQGVAWIALTIRVERWSQTAWQLTLEAKYT